MKGFRTTVVPAAIALCALAFTAWGADKPTPSGSPTGRVETPNLGDPQKLGACVQAAKESGVTATGSGGNITFKQPMIVIEAEALLGAGKVQVNGGNLAVQNMAGFGPGWGGDAQLFWSGIEPGAVLDATFSVSVPAYYDVYLHLTHAPDYGKVQTQIKGARPYWENGKPLDGWGPSVKPPGYPIPLGGTAGFPLVKGENKLSVKIIGKNEKSSGYLLGIDCIALRILHP